MVIYDRTAFDQVWKQYAFFLQAEDGIRDWSVTEFRRVLFRSRAGRRGCRAPSRVGSIGHAAIRRGARTHPARSGASRPRVATRRADRGSVAPRAPGRRSTERSEERRVGKEWRVRVDARYAAHS